MQARREKPPCNLVHVGQNLTVNGSCVTGSVVSTSSSCQRVFVTPLSRGPAGRSPVVIPQSSAQPRAVLQPPQYISCSQPPPKPQQQSQDQQASGQPFEKIFVKAVPQGTKKEGKIFTIRNVNPSMIFSCSDFKKVIREQLNEEITPHDFEIGFISGASIIRVRNEDLSELWSDLRKPGSKVTVWCDGLKDKGTASRKHAHSEDSEDERPSKRKKQAENETKVEEIVDDLKTKHGSSFSPMQLRIWAEMIAAGMHCSIDDPPNTTMFMRAGGATPYRKKSVQQSPITQALTEAAVAISTALSPSPGMQLNQGTGTSPAKVIDSRSKLYKQLSELQNLKTSGILTEEEYITGEINHDIA